MYTLDEREAFEAMTLFLETFYDRGHSDDSDVAMVLWTTHIEADGSTADPAAWHDWLEAVRQVKERTVGAS